MRREAAEEKPWRKPRGPLISFFSAEFWPAPNQVPTTRSAKDSLTSYVHASFSIFPLVKLYAPNFQVYYSRNCRTCQESFLISFIASCFVPSKPEHIRRWAITWFFNDSSYALSIALLHFLCAVSADIHLDQAIHSLTANCNVILCEIRGGTGVIWNNADFVTDF